MSIGKGVDEAILDYDWRCDGISGRSRSRQPAAQGLKLTCNHQPRHAHSISSLRLDMFRPTLVTFSPKKSKKARPSLDLTKLLQPNRRWLFNEEKREEACGRVQVRTQSYGPFMQN